MRPLFWLIIFGFLLVPTTQADIFLNEISPGSSPEYVELYNSATEAVELNNWYLDDLADKGSSPKLFSTTISALGFSVVELNSMLNNSGGDSVRLLDPHQVEIDRYDYTANISLNDIFIRCPDGGDSWVLMTIGSKAQSNLANCLLLTPTVVIEQTPTTIITSIIDTIVLPSPTAHPTPGVILSEVMVYPDNESEWVELYNPHFYSVTLTNWFLDDQENSGSTPKQFTLTIAKESYGLIELNNHIFNNTGDQVRLLDFQLKEIDHFEYDKANKNQTFSRVLLNKTGSWCSTEPTPNQTNSDCLSSEKEIINLTTTPSLLTPIINPTKAAPLGSTFALPNPTSLHFSGNLYLLPKPQVLGVQNHQSHTTTSGLVFWQQFTKISLWLSLIINTALLIYLSSSLLLLYR